MCYRLFPERRTICALSFFIKFDIETIEGLSKVPMDTVLAQALYSIFGLVLGLVLGIVIGYYVGVRDRGPGQHAR